MFFTLVKPPRKPSIVIGTLICVFSDQRRKDR
jgi:hypothetical protein